jgi:hypothetical protein
MFSIYESTSRQIFLYVLHHLLYRIDVQECRIKNSADDRTGNTERFTRFELLERVPSTIAVGDSVVRKKLKYTLKSIIYPRIQIILQLGYYVQKKKKNIHILFYSEYEILKHEVIRSKTILKKPYLY